MSASRITVAKEQHRSLPAWAASATLVAALCCLAYAAPCSAAISSSRQEVQGEVQPTVSWGSANGCVQNIEADDFGSLTPASTAATAGPFAALPTASSSVDSSGNHVWVGCVTANTTLNAVIAQGVADMKTTTGAVLATANVAIGITNQPAGQVPAGCAITAGQTQAGACTLPNDASTVRTLVGEVPAGTTELDWQYQLDLPANQPVGTYTQGEIVFTASVGSQQSANAPRNVASPTISPSTPREASQASVANGTWSPAPTSFSYQWQDCNASGAACAAIAGASASTYTPLAADVGHTLRVLVTARNASGAETVQSPASNPVLIPVPQNTVEPTVTGSAFEEGVPLGATNGTWTGSPTSYSYQWQYCVVVENQCGDIAGATGSTYTPAAVDVGRYIRVAVSAENAGGETRAVSHVTGKISAPTPISTSPPTLSTTTPIAGVSLSVSTGSWANTPTGFSYQWTRCTASGEGCSPITGATSSSYTPTEADVGHALVAQVTASNPIGAATASTSASNAVLSAKPQNTVAPTVTGSPLEEGVPLGVNNGTWTGNPTSFSYQWGYCVTIENQCGLIGGATGSTYTPTAADVGRYIRVTVTAKNGSGETAVTSRITGKISAPPPVNTSRPVLSMTTPIAKVSVSVSNGSWTNTPTSFTYQWDRCNSSGEGCSAISGATNQSYTPVEADIGHALLAQVTAANAIGSATASTLASNAVLPPKPQNTVAPTVTGSALQEGVPLTANNGTWTGNPTGFSYQWEHCDLGENPCGPIAGATGSTFTPTSTYVGKFIRVIVTARNGSGETSVTSRAVGKILPAAPGNTSLPTLSASPPIAGVSLSVSNGAWSNSPTGFTYQWKRCNSSGEGCSAISGATSQSYTPVSADVAGTLVAVVTAQNSGGQTAAASKPSAIVLELPHNTGAPALSSNSPTAGTQLNVSNGSWSGYPNLFTYAYQWLRCNSSGTVCTAISGATNSTYTPVQGDGGSTLEAQVTATNTAGQASVSTPASNLVSAPPASKLAPQLSTLAPAVEVPLSVGTGEWSGYPASFTYAYQWEDCNTLGQSCSPISGATGSSYTPGASDLGHSLVVQVTATNATGSASLAVGPTNPVESSPAPSPTSTPTFTATPAQGTSVGLANVAFSGRPAPSLAYQWRDCTSESLSSCTNISGATSATYTLTASDQGLYLSTLVSAINTYGSASTSVVPVAVNATYMQAVEADHPVADWTFNDPAGSISASDSVGWGALSGGTKTFGVQGPFSGAGTAMELSSGPMTHSGTPLDSPTVFTVEIWFKATAQDVAGDFTEDIVANQEGWIWLGLAGCTVQFAANPGNCLMFMWQNPSKPTIVVETGYKFTDTNWHYIVMTHGEDGLTHIYVDGVEYGPFNSSSQYNGLTAGTYVGGVPGSFSHYAYYDTELSSKRVAVHWQASKTS